jgi:hypothetical protein
MFPVHESDGKKPHDGRRAFGFVLTMKREVITNQ